MKMSTKTLVMALALGGAVTLAHADTGRHHASHHAHPGMNAAKDKKVPETFTEETVRKNADGKVVTKRKIEQKVTDKDFSRKVEVTNAEGKKATHQVSATYDKDKEQWSRKAEGKDFDGKTWSRSSEGKGVKEGMKRGDGKDKRAKEWRKGEGKAYHDKQLTPDAAQGTK